MKVLVTGAGGQVGRALLASAPGGVDATGFHSAALDITDSAAIAAKVAQVAPALIINAAAYTAVDKAESEPERAFAVNRDGVANLAATGVKLVHISTDFVFDGAASSPYDVNAPTNPLGVYGASKLAGEEAAGKDALIIRTAWVYASKGHNFVHTMLRLMRERGAVRVVADQMGSPTWASALAAAIWALVAKDARGLYHYTDAGTASWHDFARAIAEEACALGLLETMPEVTPITTADFPTPARRPAYSVLDTSETDALIGPAPLWRANLRNMLKEVAAHG